MEKPSVCVDFLQLSSKRVLPYADRIGTDEEFGEEESAGRGMCIVCAFRVHNIYCLYVH